MIGLSTTSHLHHIQYHQKHFQMYCFSADDLFLYISDIHSAKFHNILCIVGYFFEWSRQSCRPIKSIPQKISQRAISHFSSLTDCQPWALMLYQSRITQPTSEALKSMIGVRCKALHTTQVIPVVADLCSGWSWSELCCLLSEVSKQYTPLSAHAQNYTVLFSMVVWRF